jgi:hypothetical protein
MRFSTSVGVGPFRVSSGGRRQPRRTPVAVKATAGGWHALVDLALWSASATCKVIARIAKEAEKRDQR